VTWSSAALCASSSSSRIVGWRVWRLAVSRGRVRLRSAVFDDAWEPGRELRAACERGHGAPALACACGVYAVRSPERAVRYLVGRNDADVVHRVVGQVELRGLVIEAEHGWRAARAYPAAIWIPPRWSGGHPVAAAELATALLAYGVRIRLLAGHEPGAVVGELEAA
jgi:hypothetical protein